MMMDQGEAWGVLILAGLNSIFLVCFSYISSVVVA